MTTALATDDLETVPGALPSTSGRPPRAVRVSWSAGRQPGTAEDVLQEAFVKTLGRIDAVPAEALVPWFYTVLRDAAIRPGPAPGP